MPEDIARNFKNNSDNLDRARRERPGSFSNGNPVDMTKNISKAAIAKGFFPLLKEVDLSNDMPFVAALLGALGKDVSDFVFAETVILSMLTSILCSIFIFMMLILAGSGRRNKSARGFAKKALILIGGGAADSLPGVDFLPIETITVGMIYMMVLAERASEKK